MFLHTWHPSAIAFHLGNFPIHWYGITLALAALGGYTVVTWVAKKRSLNTDELSSLMLWLIVFGLLGGRLYHVLNEWKYYQMHPSQIFSIWNGGLAIHGALIAGLITFVVYANRHKLSPWNILDILVPGVALGQAIGRWGNYFNQELFGKPTGLPWGIPIDPSLRPTRFIQSSYFQPTFLYESIGNLVILAILLWLLRRKRQPGFVALSYFVLYGALRIVTESLRLDHTPIIAGIRLPILFSALMIAASIGLFISLWKQHHHAHPAKHRS